jgi:hypothetical protein
MTQKTADEEIRQLLGSINDLTSIQALPAIWNGRESGHIVQPFYLRFEGERR